MSDEFKPEEKETGWLVMKYLLCKKACFRKAKGGRVCDRWRVDRGEVG